MNRYAVVNIAVPPYGISMGQAKPPPERPAGVIGKFDAADAAKRLVQVVESAPECFEGEDLTVAQSLVDRLKEFSTSGRSLMGLSEEDERVLKKGVDCSVALERSRAQEAPEKAENGGFPIVPVAVGVGVGAAILILVLSV